MHDVFQAPFSDGWIRKTINWPGMPVAAVITYPAFMRGNAAVLTAIDDD